MIITSWPLYHCTPNSKKIIHSWHSFIPYGNSKTEFEHSKVRPPTLVIFDSLSSQQENSPVLTLTSTSCLTLLRLPACGERLSVWNTRRGRGNPGADSLSYSLTLCQLGNPVTLTLITGDRAKCQAPHMTMMTLEKILPSPRLVRCDNSDYARLGVCQELQHCGETRRMSDTKMNPFFFFCNGGNICFVIFFLQGDSCVISYTNIHKQRQTDGQRDGETQPSVQ